jgi:type I restriction enzyme, S subunit
MPDRPLRDVLTRVSDPVRLQSDTEYATTGILSYGRGLFERPVITGAETSYSTYYRLHRGQFVYSKLFAWEGALAVVDERFDGLFVSQEFPAFAIDATLATPEYLALLCTWPETWARVRQGETGMGGRRKRVHPDRLLDVVLPFPPIEEQHRIADIVAALDAVASGARSAGVAARSALDVLLDGWHDGYTGPVVGLGDIADMRSGPSWKASDERPVPQPGDLRVLGITNTPTGDSPDLTETKYVGGLSAATRLLGRSSLLMIRTNGNRTRIGNVYRVPPEAYGCAFSAFQIGIDLHNAEHADFVYWMLRSPRVQQAITDNASGTTGLGNIAIGWLKKVELPWPSDPMRHDVVGLFDSLGQAADLAQQEARAAAEARSVVLTSLLIGDHQIPLAYDALLDSALWRSPRRRPCSRRSWRGSCSWAGPTLPARTFPVRPTKSSSNRMSPTRSCA